MTGPNYVQKPSAHAASTPTITNPPTITKQALVTSLIFIPPTRSNNPHRLFSSRLSQADPTQLPAHSISAVA